MCLGVPGRVVEVKDEFTAIVDFGGVRREVDISLVDVEPGDYVIVHAGIAISKLDMEEAKELLNLWRQVLEEMSEEGI